MKGYSLCMIGFLVILSLFGNSWAQTACEDNLGCTSCQAQTGCQWCGVAGICLNETATYGTGSNATDYCQSIGGNLLGDAEACPTNETCGTNYGSWDCFGCKSDPNCGWCSSGRCHQAAYQTTCEAQSTWNPSCPTCNTYTNCSSCQSAGTAQCAGWCQGVNLCVTTEADCIASGNTLQQTSCIPSPPPAGTTDTNGNAVTNSNSNSNTGGSVGSETTQGSSTSESPHNSGDDVVSDDDSSETLLGYNRTYVIVAVVVIGSVIIILAVVIIALVVRTKKNHKKKQADHWY